MLTAGLPSKKKAYKWISSDITWINNLSPWTETIEYSLI